MTKNEIILVFSPGRCGTAYLAQVFGQEKWFKGMLAEPTENTLVLHEKISVDYRSLYVMKEKEFRHKDNLNIQRVYIQKILKLSETANKFFVTSNSIGRHCGYFLVDVHKKYKYIYIERDIDALITSWIKRFRNFRETYGQKNLDLHLKKMWASTKYTPLDNNSLLKIGKNEWYKMPLDNKLRWYCEELKKRWKNLKKDIQSDKYIETSYEKIITTEGLDELSEFIELPYSKELMKHRINKSQKY